eukprot:gnl/Chilomastix_cuspidata/1682.p1 GENE.gnl/Chilomastix_cuspidata/1682~~gnl/Chilomastix_cuspidata/1682.p1  ORF type:complete len:1248 (+),score=616.49 gnl/Chilomastix_cuspidata/1682:262-3744(+)
MASQHSNAFVELSIRDTEGASQVFRRAIMPASSSNFYVNGEHVSRKEYKQALSDSGFPPSHRSYLVFQGAVADLASRDPRGLTTLLEDVSGSGKLQKEFAKKKEEMETAMRQLRVITARTRAARDQKRRLKAQAREAKRFLGLKARREKLKEKSFLVRLAFITRQIRQAEMNNRKAEKTLKHEEGIQRGTKKQEAATRKALASILKQCRKAENALDKRRADRGFLLPVKRLEAEARMIATRIHDASEDRERAATHARLMHDEREELLKSREEARARLETLNKTASGTGSLPPHLIPLRRRCDIEFRREAGQLIQKVEKASGELRAAEDELQNAQEVLETLQNSLGSARQRIVRLRGEAGNHKEALGKLRDKATNAKRLREEARAALDAAEREAKEAEEDAKKTDWNYRQAHANESEMRKDRREREAVSRLRDLYPGVYGALEDLLKVPDASLQPAVSVALGRYRRAVVVSTPEVAAECMRHLRMQRLVCLTFLPLSTVTPPKPPTVPASMSRMIDCVEYQKRIEIAAEFALGGTILAQDIEEARRVGWGHSRRVRVVTRNGVVFNKSGALSISPGGAETGARAAKADVAQLADAAKAAKKRVTDARKQLAIARDAFAGRAGEGANATSSIDSQITRLRSRIGATLDALKEAEAQERQLKERIAEAKAQIGRLEEPADRSRRAHLQLESRLGKIRERAYGELLDEVGRDNFRTAHELLTGFTKEAEEAKRLAAGARSDLAAIEARIEYLSGAKGTRTAAEEKLDAIDRRVERLKKRQAQIKRNLVEAQNQSEREVTKDEQFERRVKEWRKKRDESRKELNELSRELRDHSRKAAEARKIHAAAVAKRDELRTERAHLLERARLEGLRLPVGDADHMENVLLAASRVSSQDAGRVSQEMLDSFDSLIDGANVNFRSIKAELRRLDEEDVGAQNALLEILAEITREDAALAAEMLECEPNMRAEELLSTLQKRIDEEGDEFNAARTGAEQARRAFNLVLSERHKLFMDCFNFLSKHIDAVYRELTRSRVAPRGGSAAVSLTDPEMPFLGGITYSPMPPYDSYRAIETLSGGERTVSTLAFLFTLNMYKPAPFFVLDEVDAALDLQNVQRVAHYVRKHRSDTQFLVISLKDHFFQYSDALIGVTRDGPGTPSKILTLDLTAFDK